MEILIGYGGVVLLFAIIVIVLEVNRRSHTSICEYSTAWRSFGSAFSTMAFVNTWLPGTIFILFAGFAAAAGVIGFYFVPYSLLAVVLMFLDARRETRDARRETGMGYCLLSNVSVAIEYARANLGVQRIAIVDYDVHHGNGAQSIYWNDPNVLAISIHQERLFSPVTFFVALDRVVM